MMGLSMSMGLDRRTFAGQPPIEIIGNGSTTSGAATTVSGLVSDDVVLVAARRASATPLVAPAGKSYSAALATAIGAATSAVFFWARMTDALLVDGVFSTGTFNSPGAAARVWAVGMRNVNGFTAGASASNGVLRTDRPYSALSGLTERSRVIGFTYLSTGTGPTPTGGTVLSGTDTAVGRLYQAGPTSTWDPPDAAAGASLDWLEMVAGVL